MRRLLLSLTALSLAVMPVAGAAAASCYGPAEATAVQVRMLQTELMVAALACRDSNPELGMIAKYNDFIHRLGDRLITNSKVLQAHFQKAYGAASKKHLDAFVTALANDASTRSMTSVNYCQGAAELFQNVTILERRDLEHFSAERAVAVGAPVMSCAGETSSAASVKSTKK
jgi:hypothetical protein